MFRPLPPFLGREKPGPPIGHWESPYYAVNNGGCSGHGVLGLYLNVPRWLFAELECLHRRWYVRDFYTSVLTLICTYVLQE